MVLPLQTQPTVDYVLLWYLVLRGENICKWTHAKIHDVQRSTVVIFFLVMESFMIYFLNFCFLIDLWSDVTRLLRFAYRSLTPSWGPAPFQCLPCPPLLSIRSRPPLNLSLLPKIIVRSDFFLVVFVLSSYTQKNQQENRIYLSLIAQLSLAERSLTFLCLSCPDHKVQLL